MATANGNPSPESRQPAWGRWHLIPPELGFGVGLGSSTLVLAASLPSDLFTLLPLPAGTDPLTNGDVNVTSSGSAGVTLNGAAASQSYDLWFCHYSTLPNHCGILGTAQTDASGRLNASFSFLTAGTAAAGIFAVARNGAIQYVGGFSLPAAAQGVPIAIEGTVAAVTTGATESFILKNTSLVIDVDAKTAFTGVANFAALVVGDVVLVKGLLRTDGTVLAASVKLQ